LQQSAARQKPKVPLSIYGSDLSGEAIKCAGTNQAAAGLEARRIKAHAALQTKRP
jgi:hypothetical protein